jgi:hypothetical protein
LDKPLHVIYKVSKLAYRISVTLIANERVKKKFAMCFQQKKITVFMEKFREEEILLQHLEMC